MQSFRNQWKAFWAKILNSLGDLCYNVTQCILHHAMWTYRSRSWACSWPFLLLFTLLWLLRTGMMMATCFLIFVLVFLQYETILYCSVTLWRTSAGTHGKEKWRKIKILRESGTRSDVSRGTARVATDLRANVNVSLP